MKRTSIVLDRELAAHVESVAKRDGLSVSQVIRDALRAHFAVVHGPRDAGWREGYMKGIAAVQRKVQEAFAAAPQGLPEGDGD